LRNTFIRTVTEDQASNAAAIGKPTLLLWGELDTETPVEMARRFHGLIADSSLVVVPGRDHYPFVGNGVHQCAEIINEFLARQDRATS
jgi:pimeloyl-ACP methyl ester carboxylesterase